MMHTLDVFRTGDELTVVMTGPVAPPTVVDLDSGASVRLGPAMIGGTPWCRSIVSAVPAAAANAWWGFLPAGDGDHRARLWVDADGRRQRFTARWQEEPPLPASAPNPKRRSNPGNHPCSAPGRAP